MLPAIQKTVFVLSTEIDRLETKIRKYTKLSQKINIRMWTQVGKTLSSSRELLLRSLRLAPSLAAHSLSSILLSDKLGGLLTSTWGTEYFNSKHMRNITYEIFLKWLNSACFLIEDLCVSWPSSQQSEGGQCGLLLSCFLCFQNLVSARGFVFNHFRVTQSHEYLVVEFVIAECHGLDHCWLRLQTTASDVTVSAKIAGTQYTMKTTHNDGKFSTSLRIMPPTEPDVLQIVKLSLVDFRKIHPMV